MKGKVNPAKGKVRGKGKVRAKVYPRRVLARGTATATKRAMNVPSPDHRVPFTIPTMGGFPTTKICPRPMGILRKK